jgi:hypothetical protein
LFSLWIFYFPFWLKIQKHQHASHGPVSWLNTVQWSTSKHVMCRLTKKNKRQKRHVHSHTRAL